MEDEIKMYGGACGGGKSYTTYFQWLKWAEAQDVMPPTPKQFEHIEDFWRRAAKARESFPKDPPSILLG